MCVGKGYKRKQARLPLLSFLFICWTAAVAVAVYYNFSVGVVDASLCMMEPPIHLTPVENLDGIVNSLVEYKAKEWKELSWTQKTNLLRQLIDNTREHAEDWIESSVKARDHQGRGDALVASVAIWSSYTTSLLSILEKITTTTNNKTIKDKYSRRPLTDTHTAIKVYPDGLLEQLEAIGMTGELIVNNNQHAKSPRDDDDDGGGGGVTYIMGAGNTNAPIELLCELFLHNRVCIYKPNPVNAITFVTMEEKILQPLIQAGYLSIVYDDPVKNTIGKKILTQYIKQEDKITKVVLTGAESTYQNIVQPNLSSRTTVCAELGAVNAWIIVPSKQQWNQRMINDYARHLAFSKTANNGHACACPQLYIVPRNWIWRDYFQQRLKHWLAYHAQQQGTTPPFYPNAFSSQALFQQAYPQSEYITPSKTTTTTMDEETPLAPSTKKQNTLFIPDCNVTNPNTNKLILEKEAFCPVLAEVPLDFNGTDEDGMQFLFKALEFTKSNVHGSLTMTIIATDKFLKRNKQPMNEILATMPYGLVGINIWAGMIYPLPKMVWGAFPGVTSSGTGFIGNILQYQGVEKAILHANFHNLPRRLAWTRKTRSQNKVMERFGRYKLRPNMINQLMLFSAIFTGM